MKNKPQRMCTVCRQHKENNLMVRVVKTKEGQFCVDKTHKADGRGAYVCLEQKCIDNFIKSKCLNRAFKCEVPQEIYEQLREELNIAKTAN